MLLLGNSDCSTLVNNVACLGQLAENFLRSLLSAACWMHAQFLQAQALAHCGQIQP